MKPAARLMVGLLCLTAGALSLSAQELRHGPSELRNSPVVKAVAQARPSVVNIHSEKMLPTADNRLGQIETSRRVNGMGTGVVIDERGYIITNQHVIDGVEKIQVTLADGATHNATLIAADKKTDLAVIKIKTKESLPIITIGTSSDLMTGESVIAVGNAYGYEHTVTRGIISALHRMVQLNDTQKYENLIQTDASINPGNSGGPLLNIDGEMIGINVAVRAGAQGIGFAIPVDAALEVAAELLSSKRVGQVSHGIVPAKAEGEAPPADGLVVGDLADNSPAAKSGLKRGDLITSIDGKTVARALDLERNLIGKKAGEKIELKLKRDEEEETVTLTLIASTESAVAETEQPWDVLGMKLDPVSVKQFSQFKTRYRGGMWVTEVRPDGPAARQGIRSGDVLVGLHIWETVSHENINHILNRPDFSKFDPMKFYVLRGGKTLYGFLPLGGN